MLLPIVGNAAEHTTSVCMAYKGKMELALGVAIGSSIVRSASFFLDPTKLISMFVANRGGSHTAASDCRLGYRATPHRTLLSSPLSQRSDADVVTIGAQLFFANFETIILVFSVLMVTLLVLDGKSNWMEGAMLVR